jgi:histidine triad (HIT) family protein
LRAGWSRRSDRLPGSVSADSCLFCRIVAGEVPAQIVAQDELTLAFMDINPATDGHLLVVPRTHARDLFEIGDVDLAAVMIAAGRLARLQQERLRADAVNLINSAGSAAWQTVFHFHVHVIPRYIGDPLKLPWIPTAGDDERIAEIADRLR